MQYVQVGRYVQPLLANQLGSGGPDPDHHQRQRRLLPCRCELGRHIQDDQPGGGQRDRLAERDVAHHAPVDVPAAVLQLDHRQHAGYRRRSAEEVHDGPTGPPGHLARGGVGGSHMAWDGHLGQVLHRYVFGDQRPEAVTRVEAGPSPQDGRQVADDAPPDGGLLRHVPPEVLQPAHLLDRGIVRQVDAVQRTGRHAHDLVGEDAVLQEHPQHSRLGRPPDRAAGEHEHGVVPLDLGRSAQAVQQSKTSHEQKVAARAPPTPSRGHQ